MFLLLLRKIPLRVLRVARFYARLSPLGFSVNAETESLIQAMVARDELKELAAERIWVELTRGFSEVAPHRFFECLKNVGALKSLLPEVHTSLDNQDRLPHVESDVERRIVSAIEAGKSYSLSAEENWAIVCHAVGAPARAK